MKVTEVRVRKAEGEGKVVAYVSITFDNVFVVHNLKVIKGSKGTFVAMPTRKMSTGEYKDVCHAVNSEFRKEIEEEVLSKLGE